MKLSFSSQEKCRILFIIFAYLDLVKNVSGSDCLGKAKFKAESETPQVRQNSKLRVKLLLGPSLDERFSLGYQNWNGFLVLFLFGTKNWNFILKKTTRTRR